MSRRSKSSSSASHTPTLLSLLAVSSFGRAVSHTTAAYTPARWPLHVRRHEPVSTFQTRSQPSPAPSVRSNGAVSAASPSALRSSGKKKRMYCAGRCEHCAGVTGVGRAAGGEARRCTRRSEWRRRRPGPWRTAAPCRTCARTRLEVTRVRVSESRAPTAPVAPPHCHAGLIVCKRSASALLMVGAAPRIVRRACAGLPQPDALVLRRRKHAAPRRLAHRLRSHKQGARVRRRLPMSVWPRATRAAAYLHWALVPFHHSLSATGDERPAASAAPRRLSDRNHKCSKGGR